MRVVLRRVSSSRRMFCRLSLILGDCYRFLYHSRRKYAPLQGASQIIITYEMQCRAKMATPTSACRVECARKSKEERARSPLAKKDTGKLERGLRRTLLQYLLAGGETLSIQKILIQEENASFSLIYMHKQPLSSRFRQIKMNLVLRRWPAHVRANVNFIVEEPWSCQFS